MPEYSAARSEQPCGSFARFSPAASDVAADHQRAFRSASWYQDKAEPPVVKLFPAPSREERKPSAPARCAEDFSRSCSLRGRKLWSWVVAPTTQNRDRI